MRRLDIGIASYENVQYLDQTIRYIRNNSKTDWRLLIVDNASPSPEVRQIIEKNMAEEPRIQAQFNEENTGYAGAVNTILEWAETEYIAYVDNDAYVKTAGWDEIMASYLDRYHELGMVFSRHFGAYEIPRGPYKEVLWCVGCFWMLNRMAKVDVGLFDTTLGHQEEVDYQTRLRLNGWKMACINEVDISHHASATTNPAALERISRGVINWMDKWEAYFGGKGQGYYSTNVLRFELWPCNALYMEEYYKMHVPNLNSNPETMVIAGREYDLIKVPRFKDFYTGRII